ncbi:ShlB/FhaC/HecB family hemolysin secretion/activation protein [Aphanothece hegewaldii CCALA 016]|uniref:ShlB/FhaC/HecB family hemolysin secretion/activation protein n=1 Tax=Aphanothece hegewaldii CCALA 016 TaxID=2107694 RepID=A0A2T1LRT4_9CHRO|nr:ShlB/FhaC/HecB family hemolysin secretion/activation protein [Aphanothece hegewaldii]PSF31704.1 ShlB/FhaC/HecB family hemolysin secretion/activation protein [Aphanothece hegewaldii CCALA 016]
MTAIKVNAQTEVKESVPETEQLEQIQQLDEQANVLFEVKTHQLRSETGTLISSEPLAPSTQISVQKIEVQGNTVLEQKINNLIQPFFGQIVSLQNLSNLADSITELYLNEGYLTSRAVLPQQDFADGMVTIQVVEGVVEEVIIKGATRLENYVRSRIQVGLGQPLNSGKLEDQLRLLKTNPLLKNIEATLKAGSEENKSILEVFVAEANPFFGSVGFNNYSPPSIGSVQANINLGYRNVVGLGDSLAVSYLPRVETWLGTYQVDVNYQVPLNPMEGALQLRTSIEENEVIQGDFVDLDIRGESQYYEISYRQPIIRSPRQEFALSLGMSYRNGQTFTFQGPFPFGIGPDEDGYSRTNVITFGQDYVLRELTGAWAFRSQFRFGTGIFEVTSNPSPIPDGYFFSWLGQIQRIQILGKNNFLVMQGDIQLTPDSLLPSEQFVIGGGQSVRGYRQNVRAGDNGFRFSIEDQITLVRDRSENPVFILAPFFDMGYVWNHPDNPNFQDSQRFIAGLGLGVLWQPIQGMSVRLDYAPPLIELDDRGNDVQDDGFYFSVNYQF